MGIVEMKTRIHEIIDDLDEPFLKVVHSMLNTYAEQIDEDTIVSYDIDGTPRTSSELGEILDARAESALAGNTISIEELKKESDKWLEDTV